MEAAERIRARRRRMRRQRLRRIGAWALVILAELVAATAAAAAAAAVLVPMAQAERGRSVPGSEWMAVAAVFCAAYGIIHSLVCSRIYGEG